MLSRPVHVNESLSTEYKASLLGACLNRATFVKAMDYGKVSREQVHDPHRATMGKRRKKPPSIAA